MKSLINLWVAFNEYLWGFEVHVKWGNKSYVHKAGNLEQAKQWLSCYPNACNIKVVSLGSDRVVMARNGLLAGA